METTTNGAEMSRTDEWYAYRNRVSETCETNSLGPLVAFEQVALRSAKEKCCMECGDPGTMQQSPSTYNHVPYWFCDDCDAYWKAKAA